MKRKIGGSIYEGQTEKGALSDAVSALAPVSLYFREMDISPYKVAVIEKVDAQAEVEPRKSRPLPDGRHPGVNS